MFMMVVMPHWRSSVRRGNCHGNGGRRSGFPPSSVIEQSAIAMEVEVEIVVCSLGSVRNGTKDTSNVTSWYS